MPANNRRLKVHPHLARVAGVAPPPGMSWQIGHYIFVPCEDQVHGDGNPDLESVALMPAEATVSGPWPVGTTQFYNGSQWIVGAVPPGHPYQVWTGVGWQDREATSAEVGLTVGATRGGGAEVWNGSAWVPNVPGAVPARPSGLVVGSTRGGGAEVWNGSAWVPNVPGAVPGRPSSLVVGATRGGGAEVWNGSAWVRNPAYRRPLVVGATRGGGAEVWNGAAWVPNPGRRRPLVVGATRGGGAEVWTGSAWVPNPAYQGAGGGLAVGATRGGGAEVWTGSAWVPNPGYQGEQMPASMALQLAGIIGGGQQTPSGGQGDLSASDLVALGAAAGAADQGGGGDLLSTLANGGDGGGDGGDLLSVLASAGAGGGDGDGDGDF